MSLKVFYEDIIKKISHEGFERVQAARIGIAGAGGLGSNCSANLVRAGFKKLTVVDFDVIDPTNLDRQFYFLDQVGAKKVEALKTNLLRINPELELDMISKKIEKTNIGEIFGDCDAVCECVDTAECKSILVSGLVLLGKFTVAVSGLGGFGSSDDIVIHKLKKNLIMIGDLRSDISQRPALSPRVNIAAAKQADVILEYVISSARKEILKKT